MPDSPSAQTPIPVGIVDSGYRDVRAACIEAARGFALAATADLGVAHMRRVIHIERNAMTPDPIGHGSAVLDHIARLAPGARFHVAQVFHAHARTSPAQIAASIDWLIGQRVRVINLSLGLRADRAPLRAACQRATQAGIVVCAASPARGAPVFPASYPDVIRITGDARCHARAWSWLDSAQADFGAAMTQEPGAADDDAAGIGGFGSGGASGADRAGKTGDAANICGDGAGDTVNTGRRGSANHAENTGNHDGTGNATNFDKRGGAGHAENTGNRDGAGNATNTDIGNRRTANLGAGNARASSRVGAPVGASMATAIMSGHIAAWLARHPQANRAALLAHLRAHAAFVGIERRVCAS